MISSVLALGLASVSFALAPSKASLAVHSELKHSSESSDSESSSISSHVASETPSTTTGPAVPWQFRAFSEHFVPAAASLRASDVAEDVASSAAKKLVDGALSPPEYTSLLSEGFQIWATDGIYPEAKDVYNLATDASSAYDQVHTNLSYWSFVSYARSAASLFDLAKLETVPTFSVDSHISKNLEQKSAFIGSIVSSLKADPTGSAALETFKKVSDNYAQDFGIPAPKSNSNIIETILMKALGSL